MIVSIQKVKSWLKVDYNEEDDDIQDLIDAAETYLSNATGIIYDSSNALAVLYCKVLITDWFENRSLLIEDKKISDKVRFTLQSILMQLQY